MSDITQTRAWRSAEAAWLEQPDEREECEGPDPDQQRDEALAMQAEMEDRGGWPADESEV
jgi:hypothetical protein